MFGIESVCAHKEFVVSFNKYFFCDAANELWPRQDKHSHTDTWLNHFVSSIYNRIWGGSVVL
jgi:hypothetical protein